MSSGSRVVERIDERRSKIGKFSRVLYIVLFVATCVTTTMRGASFADMSRLPLHTVEDWVVFFLRGCLFSVPLMGILLAHEMGHFIAGKRHSLNITPPLFIPCPPISLFGMTLLIPGTFGAIIKIRSLITDRNALIRVGAWGPLAGSFVAIPMLAVGVYYSQSIPLPPGGQEHVGISFGTSALLELMCWVRFGHFSFEQAVLLHPIGLAAWYGLFVTALNLLPIGQLDGGHVLYALLGPRKAPIGSLAVLICLIPLGILLWPGWLFFGVLVTILGWRHPPPLDPYTPLDRGAKLIGCAAVILFLLIFIPIPISL